MDAAAASALRLLGSNMRAERVRRNLTQEAVAAKTGLGTTQVARIERGETDSDITKYLRIAAAIGIDPAELFHGLSAAELFESF